jgi:hypothetical protein
MNDKEKYQIMNILDCSNRTLSNLKHENENIKILLYRMIKKHGNECDGTPIHDIDLLKKITNSEFRINSDLKIIQDEKTF